MAAALGLGREKYLDDWVGEWEAEMSLGPSVVLGVHSTSSQNKSISRLVRDVRRDEKADMRNRFLSISMDAEVCV